MKIALLAPFEEQVPPLKYGGTELVVSNLAETLVARGHEVILLATGDSKTSARLIPTFPRAIRTDKAAQDMVSRGVMTLVGIDRVMAELEKLDVDIIHNHIGWWFSPFIKFLHKPVVTTLHGQLDLPSIQIACNKYKEQNYVSISNSQREPFPSLSYAATVYNGIDVTKFTFNEKPKGGYLAFLGRMSPEKGPLDAIKIAKAAGKRLIMAAKVDPAYDGDYFEKEVRPLIDGKQIQFIGEVDHAGKNELLGNADALIAPINWREPFGLFFVEAMACGTPVIARNRGAAPELVQSGVTGFICETNEEMVTAVNRISTISRQACRQRITENFSCESMTGGYEAVYQKLINK